MRALAAPLALAVALTLAAATPAATASAAAGQAEQTVVAAASPRKIDLARWDGSRRWRSGTRSGTAVRQGRLVFATAPGSTTAGGARYDTARWTSGWTAPGFSFTELIASWSAQTPGASRIEIRVRGRSGTGRPTSWDLLGRWAASDRHLKRRSFSGQGDDGTSVNVDTWRTAGLTSYQLRVRLVRRTSAKRSPSLDLVTAMTSRLPATAGGTSEPGVADGTVLRVPRYSQMTHRGDYPQWGGGGTAWCSPTSTSMVLGYYDALPAPKRYSWVPDGHPQPWVDYAARMTYDYSYDGTGNWPFNTAYAAPRAGKAFVTRLRSLREAERFIAAGIPLVVSIAFDRGELDGAPIASSNGHLLVIAGFRTDGDVVVNDPAAATRQGVRRTYDRGQFEKVWREASGGLTYVVHRSNGDLPGRSPGNW